MKLLKYTHDEHIYPLDAELYLYFAYTGTYKFCVYMHFNLTGIGLDLKYNGRIPY